MESDIKKQRELQHQVLRYLSEEGPIHYNNLYLQFDTDQTGAIGAVLQDLMEWKCVDLVYYDQVSITPIGIQLLERVD
ncbi:hypothetical protein W02_32090 [Nitrospira sp. KM1]|uniref:hypothetical protein n=1 Tax=Nitrospira sp. KM1 TaxID=1936990 RepID=UPI0013A77453|nr:hypothetical protein [Nitrospira sp. KM1]BCA56069.1 hypothetical protein W02_32090 [Nitrospira sp. KM1]